MPEAGDITRLLRDWKEGDKEAFEALLPLVYPDLKRIASGYLRRERPDHTLQATGLVHEVYLRIAQVKHIALSDRRHFYTFAAQMMRVILIVYARQRRALKRPHSAALV